MCKNSLKSYNQAWIYIFFYFPIIIWEWLSKINTFHWNNRDAFHTYHWVCVIEPQSDPSLQLVLMVETWWKVSPQLFGQETAALTSIVLSVHINDHDFHQAFFFLFLFVVLSLSGTNTHKPSFPCRVDVIFPSSIQIALTCLNVICESSDLWASFQFTSKPQQILNHNHKV